MIQLSRFTNTMDEEAMTYDDIMRDLDNVSGFTYEDTKQIPLFVSIFIRDIHTDEYEYLR